MTQTPPRVTAADVTAAAGRLLGTLVLDLATMTVGPATYLPRLEAFATIEATRDAGADLGPDDGSLIVLVQPGTVRELIEEHGTPGRAAQALTRRLRTERLA